MTKKFDYTAKFMSILNRKDIFINADISAGLYESYNVVTDNGVKLLSLKISFHFSLRIPNNQQICQDRSALWQDNHGFRQI